ncbi:cob(I)yrinic acid a,c-diamide adenosyltransferase [Marinobacter koreensis]|jgi:cob(I)alamin adenosyltransferase|uniref:Corrinoid adenosyltransferase n=1 Tax=Marinobacter koreensis TaxID=335974 RepID=A0ABW0RJ13_9GAMM|nr:cob(I)yrinic acid a,c-diamide adenosyltransferase [Marinobacter koreensis]MCK7548099.1 cob(I)yrinic acid a,c-diamide adenosyltransferase [Marinobacter koreensis]MDX1818673.1 cob(I)yrinic acid a,c-diamide adenosyltransferase [Marinobacter sp.]
MGNRLSKIYTRTGDDGSTGLADGNRIAKNAQRVEAMGTADELNSHIGVLIETLPSGDELVETLRRIQHHLFDLGGEFAIPGSQVIGDDHIQWLEQTLDHHNESLPPLKNFILPGGTAAAAQCHLARAVCRRAERVVVALGHEDSINTASRHYLNRLSDLLFVIARQLARQNGGQEILWEQKKSGL